MTRAFNRFSGSLLFFLFLSIFPKNAFAQLPPPVSGSISVSTSVDDTSLIFEGRASPQAYVVFMQGNNVVGTTVANQGGYFLKQLKALKPGITIFSIYYTDMDQQVSSTIKYTINVAPHTDTYITKVMLPPTIDIAKHTIPHDGRVRLRGRAVPGSSVVLFLFDEKSTKTVEVDETGYWSYMLEASKYSSGKYKIHARAFDNEGNNSKDSARVVMEILEDPNSKKDIDLEDLANNTFVNLTPTPPCSLPAYLSPFDSDNTCHINSDEYIVMVKEWYDQWKKRSDGDCDVDEDGDCDLVDFSIVLYYVNR